MEKKSYTDLSSVFSQWTSLADRQSDRILIAKPRLHSMQRGKNQRPVFSLLFFSKVVEKTVAEQFVAHLV